MAHPSPPPSSSSRRCRLSELLEQRQEPFSLDIYLLDKGCSPLLLDAAAGDGGGGACSPCWPRTRSGGRALRRPPASKEVSGRTLVGGVLRLLVSKILRGTTAKKKKKLQQAASGWGGVAGEKPASHFKNTAAASPPPHRALEAGKGEVEQEEEVAEDASSSKQLSPVSVLERFLFDQSSPPWNAQTEATVVILGDLLPAAYTPTLLELLANAKGGGGSNISKDSRRSETSPPAPTRNNNRARREDAFSEENALAMLTGLVASEVAAVWAAGPRDLRWDVATDIAAVVLEALTEEAAAELIDGDGP